MSKRGGVTPYIVIGLVILLIAIIISFVVSSQKDPGSSVTHIKTSSLKIQPYVSECLKQVSLESIFDISFRGEKSNYLDKDETKKAMESYIKSNIKDCADFSLFREFEIERKEALPEVSFRDSQVIIDLEWPILISQNKLSLEINQFGVFFPLALEEIFEKVEKIKDSNLSLDFNSIFDQEVDIFLEGCRGDSLIYKIEDERYFIDDKFVPFFFDVPIKDLINLFSFEDKLEYKLPVKGGKQILRMNSKKLTFDTLDSGVVSGCYDTVDKIESYTFGLVEDNNVVASATSDSKKRIDISHLNNTFTFSSEGNNSVTLTFYVGEELLELKNTSYSIQGDYLIVNNTSLGTYELISNDCKTLKRGDKNVIFTSLNYGEDLFIKHSKLLISQIKSKYPSLGYQLVWENNTCDSFECGTVSSQLASKCEVNGDDLVIGLIHNPSLGLEYNNSLFSSYLTEDENFCVSCNIISEINQSLDLQSPQG